MARWKYRKRKSTWMRWTTPVLAIGLVGAWYVLYPRIAPQDWVGMSASFGTCGERGRPFYCVSDGDTVTLGYGANARRIRLLDFDAPEIAGRCDAERAQALLAQRALRDWLNRGPFEWDGGTKPPRDKFGRELREVRRIFPDGSEERLADYMVGAKLAEGEGPWERRNWCE